MRKTGLLLLFCCLVLACNNTVVDPLDDISDDIIYTDLDPDVSLSSVVRYDTETQDECTSQIPVPADSMPNYRLDIDGDAVADFIIVASHNKLEDRHECGPCSVYEYQIAISGTGENNYISYNTTYSWVPKWYSRNDTIRPGHDWHTEVFLSMQGGCDRWIIDLEDIYVGVKHNADLGWIHIRPEPNNGILIMEYAINQTDNRNIAAGQKE